MTVRTYTTPLQVKNFIFNNSSKSFNVFAKIRRIDMSNVEDSGFVFSHALIVVDPSFAGDCNFEITFTSTTTYTVRISYGDEYTNLLYGSGVISSDFEVVDFILIPDGTFGGVINVGDSVKFGVTRSVSEDQLDYLIGVAETEVDSYAKSTGLVFVDSPQMRTFGLIPEHVPPEISLAATKWVVALLIQSGAMQVSVAADPETAHYEALKNSARKNIRQYGEFMSRGVPKTVSREDIGSSNGTTKKTLTEFVASTKEFDNVDPTVAFISEGSVDDE